MTSFLIFLLDWSIKSAATVALALILAGLIRKRSAASNHLVWRIALLVIVFMPFAMRGASQVHAPSVIEPIQAPVRAVISPLEPRPVSLTVIQVSPATFIPSPPQQPDWSPILAGIYFLGAFMSFAYWINSYRKIKTIVSQSVDSNQPNSPAKVLIASDPELRVPITFGLKEPVIVLPNDADGWPQRRIEAALLHEAAHIARKDWAWQTASFGLRALQWFNPAIWLLSKAINSTSESSADDEVLATGLNPVLYAGELLNVAEGAQSRLPAATAMARRKGIGARVERIVSREIDRSRPGWRLTTVLGTLFGAGGLAFAVGTIGNPAMRAEGSTPFAAKRVSSSKGVKLKQGGILRLAYVSQSTDGLAPIWHADGSVAGQADLANFAPLGKNSFGTDTKPGFRVVVFNYEISDLHCPPGVTDSVIYRIHDNKDAHYVSGIGLYSHDIAVNRDAWTVPASLSHVDIDCLISSEPYKTILRAKIGDGQFHAKVEARSKMDPIVAPYGSPGSNQLHGAPDSSRVVLTTPKSLEGKDLRILLLDADGVQIPDAGSPAISSQTDPATHEKIWQYSYDGIPAARIAGFELQARDFEKVVLTGVKLRPNAAP